MPQLNTEDDIVNNNAMQILERHTLGHHAGVSALSGVACVGSDIYFIGDDVRYLLKTQCNMPITSSTVFEKIALFESSKHIPLAPLAKADKPDFEALSCIDINGQQQLLIMGSGSTEKRKQALVFNPVNQQIQTFFNTIDYDFLAKNLELTGGAELNIEAVCADAQSLYIFQRGNINRHHGVLVFDLAQIQAGKSLQQARVNALSLQLPNIEGSASGISDACFLAHKNLIVATAAVEQTANTYDDGAVLGSFIIILAMDGKTLATQLLQEDNGQPIAIKVEGITWLESTQDGEVFLLVTDSDGGDSEVLKVLLSHSSFTHHQSTI